MEGETSAGLVSGKANSSINSLGLRCSGMSASDQQDDGHELEFRTLGMSPRPVVAGGSTTRGLRL